MTKAQKLALIFLFLGHAACWLTLKELWPFSHYPMYSKAFTPTEFKFLKLKAVSSDGREFEPNIYEAFFPFWNLAFFDSFMERRSEKERFEFLKEMLALYKVRRTKVFTDWPEIKGLRIYRMTYDWNRVKSSFKQGIRFGELEPDKTELIMESSEK